MFFGLRILFLAVLIWTAAFAHAVEPQQKEIQSRPLLGTVVTMEACRGESDSESVRSAMSAAWVRISEIHVQMNFFDEKSDVSLINKAAGKPVKVHDDALALLRRSREFWRRTCGAFDVTIAPLSRLWKEAALQGKVPDKSAVANARSHIGAGRIEISSDDLVRLSDPMMSLDLNGDAQGFAADEAVAVLRKAGLKDFLVDAGGEIYAAGHNCTGQKWRVGISNPNDPGKMIEIAELSNAAISTSGDYEKYFEIKGRRFSHIIDPITGYPVKGAASVTVIAPTATEADAYSTALSVMGVKKGFPFVASLGAGYEALIYQRDEKGGLTRYVTSGYNNYRRQTNKE